MIKTESLVYKLDLRLNSLASNDHQDTPIENKILILRESIIELIIRKLNPNNPLLVGFDGNKKRYHDLEVLVEKPNEHPLDLTSSDTKLNKWDADLTLLDPDIMFIIGGYIIADKGDCKDHVLFLDTELTKHKDVAILLGDSNYRPSFEYQETFSSISNSKLEVYTDGTFTPKKVYPEYIRYPTLIDYTGYEDFDGNASTIVDSELPGYLESEILDIAVEKITDSTSNQLGNQNAKLKIKTNE